MKICCISDTHNFHKDITFTKNKGIDTIVHCGDFTDKGTFKEIKAFLDWYVSVPVKYRILIAGNHDITMDVARYNSNTMEFHPTNEMQENANLVTTYIKQYEDQGKLIYLQNSQISIDGITFYGSPHSLEPTAGVPPWGFQYNEVISNLVWSAIPSNIDVLLTHTPPYGILDKSPYGHRGSKSLLDHVKNRIQPALHVFGHVHGSHGYERDKDTETIFVNAVVVNGKKKVVYEPIIIEI
jgi:Icc-related predicted phosphoesterase